MCLVKRNIKFPKLKYIGKVKLSHLETQNIDSGLPLIAFIYFHYPNSSHREKGVIFRQQGLSLLPLTTMQYLCRQC
jgi:hypothetical protein